MPSARRLGGINTEPWAQQACGVRAWIRPGTTVLSKHKWLCFSQGYLSWGSGTLEAPSGVTLSYVSPRGCLPFLQPGARGSGVRAEAGRRPQAHILICLLLTSSRHQLGIAAQSLLISTFSLRSKPEPRSIPGARVLQRVSVLLGAPSPHRDSHRSDSAHHAENHTVM